MSDAMTDAYNEMDVDLYWQIIKKLLGMKKRWVALEVAKACEKDVISKYKGTPRRWQREIRSLMDKGKEIESKKDTLEGLEDENA